MKHIILAAIFCFSMLTVALPVMAQDDTIVYFTNGASLVVPSESWSVLAAPKGFNTAPYDPWVNPKGKLSGWGGWPNYEGKCEPQLSLGETRHCDRQPYFQTGEQDPNSP
jgi:hypothetical protein